jgi:hypothetical protein
MMRRVMLLSLACLAALWIGCGGNGKSDEAIVQTPLATQQAPKPYELAAMMVPPGDMGSDYADFQPGEGSGVVTNESLVQLADDRDDMRNDIDKFGRATGYQTLYLSPAAMIDGKGAMAIATAVEVLRDSNAAAGYMTNKIEDTTAQIGTQVSGSVVEDVGRFEVDAVAEGAIGLKVRGTVPMGSTSITVFSTLVYFQEGRFMGLAFIERVDDTDVREEVTALAQKLDDRIAAVTSGDMTIPTQAAAAAGPGAQDAIARGIHPTNVLSSFKYSLEVTITGRDGATLLTKGDFVGPNLMDCNKTTVENGAVMSTTKIVANDHQGWRDSGNGYEPVDWNDSDFQIELASCPGSDLYWQRWAPYLVLDTPTLEPIREVVNGVPSLRYTLSQNVLDFGASSGGMPTAWQDLETAADYVWFAQDEKWPVSWKVDISGPAEAFAAAMGLSGFEPNSAGNIQMLERMDITNPNDPSIVVDVPGE